MVAPYDGFPTFITDKFFIVTGLIAEVPMKALNLAPFFLLIQYAWVHQTYTNKNKQKYKEKIGKSELRD